jgi:hypothetical protein
MPRKKPPESDYAILLAAGLAFGGAVLLTAAAESNAREERRRLFRERLTRELQEQSSQTLVGATLGRGPDNLAFWDLTLQDRVAQLWSIRVPLGPGADPYDQSTHEKLLESVGERAA